MYLSLGAVDPRNHKVIAMWRRTRSCSEIRVESREVVERGVEIGTDAAFECRDEETLPSLRV